MKTPITTEPITIKTKRMGGDRYVAKAWSPALQKKFSATATSGERFAANNLAVRYFFDGCTQAQGITRAEWSAFDVKEISPHVWMAFLKRTPRPKNPKTQTGTTIQKLIAAAKIMDWGQVFLNGGPPCFHMCEDGRFCGRAQRWQGHDSDHIFVSLHALLALATKEAA